MVFQRRIHLKWKGLFKTVSLIRTPMLIQGRLERTETNLMHIKLEVTWTQENQPKTF